MNIVTEFRVPAVIVFGCGAVKRAGVEAKKLNSKKAFIVTDESMIKVGNLDNIQARRTVHATRAKPARRTPPP